MNYFYLRFTKRFFFLNYILSKIKNYYELNKLCGNYEYLTDARKLFFFHNYCQFDSPNN